MTQFEDDKVYLGHAYGDQTSRMHKAHKIERILSDHIVLQDADMLDLGADSGLLSSYFKSRARSVAAADRDISVFEPDDIEVHETPDTRLPFPDGSFDIIIYNHVIEHVGMRSDQAQSLKEIHRCLRPHGILYLAVPNKWTLIEPHYQIPFLSWLPSRLADPLVRMTGKQDFYDCNPFAHGELLHFVTMCGFAVTEKTDVAFHQLIAIEKADSMTGSLLSAIPKPIVKFAIPLMPTFVIIGEKSP